MKILTGAAGIAGLMLAFPSLAQDTTAAGTTMGQTWDAPLADTFFNPGGSMTLRTEPEIQASWASLTDDQKQQVRNDCAAFGTDSAAMDAGASGGAAGGVSDTTASADASADAGASATGETAGGTQGEAATASPDPAEGTDAATDMTQPKSGSTENATVAEDDGSTGAGESTMQAGTVAEGSAATGSEPASGMDPSAVSLTTWTQICTMVEDL